MVGSFTSVFAASIRQVNRIRIAVNAVRPYNYMKLNVFQKTSTVIAALVAVFGFTTQLRAQTNVLNVYFSGCSIVYGSYYVGPYNFLLSSAQSTQAVALVCMNFTNDISPGQTWQANVSTFNNISLTYNPTSLRQYQEMGWLYDYGVANSSQWGAVNYAIWAVNEGSATEANGGWSQAAADLLAEAQTQTFTNGQFSNLAILTFASPHTSRRRRCDHAAAVCISPATSQCW